MLIPLATVLPEDWPLPPGFLLTAEFVLLFITGTVVGSLLNVCIYRLAWEKSILWPLKSYCGHCYQPIRWYDNLPLVSYLVLRGRCRTCGAPFSWRYFAIELLTGLGFVGIFYLDVIVNVYDLDVLQPRNLPLGDEQIALGLIPLPAWLLFSFHAVLMSLLIVASFIDIDHMEIPFSVTATGMILGLVAGPLLWPWLPAGTPPQPPGRPVHLTQQRLAAGQFASLSANPEPRSGLYPAPVWQKLPHWLPWDSRKTGLATGLAGVAAGTLMLRMVRFSFAKGRGMEGLGVGDADLMMMAGAFIGWQPIVIAFFVSVGPALFFGIAQLIRKGDQQLPYGPSLAIAIMATALGWHWVPLWMRLLFYESYLVLIMAGAAVGFLFVAAVCLRLIRGTPEQTGETT
jgi:leader peptidase (prepilin peptidase)/N-methyltransferase